ncbi:MAG: peptidoglycan DD-metalloendopeptidase family protein [Candidatus Binatia bacterium]
MGGRGSARLFVVVLLAIAFVACGPRSSGRGIHHDVRRGENLFRIGKAYGIDYRDLARRNGIRDPAQIEVGQKVFIPGATRRLPVEIITPRTVETAPKDLATFARGTGFFRWPILGARVASSFGPRGGSFHDGIDIASPEGTPVHASRAGRVIYSDELRGYGKVVIVEHEEEWVTVYAHNSRNEVDEGDRVAAGDVVSLVGATGRATGPNLHFEVRRRNAARDPLLYLPSINASSR